MFEVFEHTADVGIRVRAPDLPTLFVDAARGLFSVLVTNLDAVRPVHEERIRVAGNPAQCDDLLFDWLAELLYVFDTQRCLFSSFEVRLNDDGLEGTARGEPIDRSRHEMDMEVKAITYHGLKVESGADGWLAEVIVDL